MKRTLFAAALAGTMMLAAVTSASAQDDMVDPVQESVDSVMLDCCCCDQSRIYFGAEATFMKFFDSGGVEDFGGDDGRFDWEASPRFTLGWEGCDGLGTRVRYWKWDHTTLSVDDDPISVDTYTIDLEVYQRLEVGSCTNIEIMGGIRYNEFIMDRSALPTDRFRGFGGLIGIQADRQLTCNWSAYGRLREVILADDFFALEFGNSNENDGIRDVTEIALGVEYNNCNWSFHAGYEWHLWSNYTRGTIANADLETSDIGFAGFVVGGELSY